jgi:hypothetical protein
MEGFVNPTYYEGFCQTLHKNKKFSVEERHGKQAAFNRHRGNSLFLRDNSIIILIY